jgi:hypothetical protein
MWGNLCRRGRSIVVSVCEVRVSSSADGREKLQFFSALRDGELLDQIAQRGEIKRQMRGAQMVVQGTQTR